MANGLTVKTKNRIDWMMLAVVFILVAFGLLMIFSASSYEAQLKHGSSLFFVKKQAVSTVIGFVGMVAAAIIPYDFWKSKISFILFLVACVTTALVRTSIGIDANGARRWISLKFMTFQPAELVKVAVILCMATLLFIMKDKMGSLKGFLVTCVPTGIAAILIAWLTKDLGTSIIIFLIGMVMVAAVAPKPKYFLVILVVLVVALAVLIIAEPYRWVRITTWLNVEAYAGKETYQTMQALYAIASGGVFGKGLGKSTQKMGFIPESENDMIFSIICEELGIFGALALLVLIAFLIWRMWILYTRSEDMFAKLIVAGVMAHIGFQTFINVGVVSALIPNTGVPLPFISYGGSSIMMLLIEIGLVLAVAGGKTIRKPEAVKNAPKKKKKRPLNKKTVKAKVPVYREDKERGVISRVDEESDRSYFNHMRTDNSRRSTGAVRRNRSETESGRKK